MNRPLRSSTETGVVTRLVSTRTTSFASFSAAAFSAALCAAISAGDGGGVFGSAAAPRPAAGLSFFRAGVLRDRPWPRADTTKTPMNKRQSADLFMDTILLGEYL